MKLREGWENTLLFIPWSLRKEVIITYQVLIKWGKRRGRKGQGINNCGVKPDEGFRGRKDWSRKPIKRMMWTVEDH